MRLTAAVALVLGLVLPVRASAPLRMTAADALWGYHNYPEEFALTTEAIEHANPLADAKVALVRGDETLIELCEGYAGCVGPEGVATVHRLNSRAVPGTIGCVTGSREQELFRAAVRTYAQRYNQFLAAAVADAEAGQQMDGADGASRRQRE
jgi:hypothetical protein